MAKKKLKAGQVVGLEPPGKRKVRNAPRGRSARSRQEQAGSPETESESREIARGGDTETPEQPRGP